MTRLAVNRFLWTSVVIWCWTQPPSTGQDLRGSYTNRPVNWNYDRNALSGNQANFYNPGYRTQGRDTNSRSMPIGQSFPGSAPQPQTSKPQPVQSVYPWAWSNQQTPAAQPYTPRPAQPQTPPTIYSQRPQPPVGAIYPTTQRPPVWSGDRSNDRPAGRGGSQFDLVDFQSLPDSYKTAFMTVEELVRNRGMINPPGPNSQNVKVVFDSWSTTTVQPDLQPMIDDILPSLVPGTWRSMTLVQGCCPALRYHAANETLINVSGQQKKIVHFSKYNPPMYQFIPHGLCTQGGTYSGSSNCLQGSVTMSLLIYDLRFNPPLSFDVFSIPSYCNCVQY